MLVLISVAFLILSLPLFKVHTFTHTFSIYPTLLRRRRFEVIIDGNITTKSKSYQNAIKYISVHV